VDRFHRFNWTETVIAVVEEGRGFDPFSRDSADVTTRKVSRTGASLDMPHGCNKPVRKEAPSLWPKSLFEWG